MQMFTDGRADDGRTPGSSFNRLNLSGGGIMIASGIVK